VPFVNAITLAFYETNGLRSRAFVGLDNFCFASRRNFRCVANTTLFALVSVCSVAAGDGVPFAQRQRLARARVLPARLLPTWSGRCWSILFAFCSRPATA
jgi:ABC-type sugar transport system permease subunit